MTSIKLRWSAVIDEHTPGACALMDGAEYGSKPHPQTEPGECRCVVVADVIEKANRILDLDTTSSRDWEMSFVDGGPAWISIDRIWVIGPVECDGFLEEDARLIVDYRKLAPDLANAVIYITKVVDDQRIEIADLKRRISQYECPEHKEPKFGECEECDKHDSEPPWREI